MTDTDFSNHRVRGVGLRDVFRHGDGIYRVIGIAPDPTVIIEDVDSHERVTLMIGSPQFLEYEHLIAKDSDA